MNLTVRDLKPGSRFIVRGQVQYSRITSLIEGEELDEVNMRRMQLKQRRGTNVPTINYPHTTITVINPKVIPMSKSKEDIQAAEYGKGRIYKGNDGVSKFSREDRNVPRTLIKTERGIQPITLKGELGPVTVDLIYEVYRSKTMNQGVGLQHIVIHGPIKYYNENSSLEEIAKALGYEFVDEEYKEGDEDSSIFSDEETKEEVEKEANKDTQSTESDDINEIVKNTINSVDGEYQKALEIAKEELKKEKTEDDETDEGSNDEVESIQDFYKESGIELI